VATPLPEALWSRALVCQAPCSLDTLPGFSLVSVARSADQYAPVTHQAQGHGGNAAGVTLSAPGTCRASENHWYPERVQMVDTVLWLPWRRQPLAGSPQRRISRTGFLLQTFW